MRVGGLLAAGFAALVAAAAAGAESDRRSQAGVRLTGVIEVHANLVQDSMSLTFNGSARFDVMLTVNPDEVVTVPMAYDWTGVSGSCRWGGSGGDGELRFTLRGIQAGRPLVDITGSTPYPQGACNNEFPSSVSFQLYTYQLDESGLIAPDVGWGAGAGSIRGKGTGKLSLQCVGCGTPPGATYKVRALWFRGINFSPPEPRAGRPVRMTENVALLEKSSRDTFWTVVKSAKVAVKCSVSYTRSRRAVRRTTVRGRWRTPQQAGGREGSTGQVVCGPWRIPRSARGSWLGVTPRVTYRGQTLRGPSVRVGLFD